MSETAQLAERTFAAFSKGLGTAQWADFFELLDDDVELWFPRGDYKGRNVGKPRVMEFFRYVSGVFPQGLTISDIIKTTVGENNVIFEFRDEGSYADGKPYLNRVTVSLEFRNGRVARYREYFGGDGTFN